VFIESTNRQKGPILLVWEILEKKIPEPDPDPDYHQI